jgi:hypothetical protein
LYAFGILLSAAYALARSALLLKTAATRLFGCELIALIMRVFAISLAPIKAHRISSLV